MTTKELIKSLDGLFDGIYDPKVRDEIIQRLYGYDELKEALRPLFEAFKFEINRLKY